MYAFSAPVWHFQIHGGIQEGACICFIALNYDSNMYH